jgi:hypothetical protein
MFEFKVTYMKTKHLWERRDETGQATNATGAQATGSCD